MFFKEDSVNAQQLIDRLYAVARDVGMPPTQLRLIASVGDRWFALTQSNFQVNQLGILNIELPVPLSGGQ